MKTFLALILLILIGIGGVWLWKSRDAADTAVPASAAGTYQNATYGYALSYPRDLSVHEYLPEIVSIGHPIPDGFDSVVDVSVERGESYLGASSTDAYAIERAMTKCAADGPTGSIDCRSVVRSKPFTTLSGLSGTELYLSLVHTTFGTTTASTTAEFGPVYAFDIGANTPNAPFGVLLVYQPLPAFLGAHDAALATEIANSLSISKRETR